MAFDGKKLKEAREALGKPHRPMTQERFAELIGVSKRSPGRWENGPTSPRMKQLVRISEATGRPIGWFFHDDSANVIPHLGLAEALATMKAELLESLAEDLQARAVAIRSSAAGVAA